MRNPRDVDALLFATESTGAKMVFIDTFNRAMGSGWNENNNADVSAMRETQERIRSELGATVIAIHHPAKDATGSGLRGHSSLYDDPSFVIRLEEKGGIIKVDHSKMRNGPRITIGRYELVDVTPAPGAAVLRVTGAVNLISPNAKAWFQYWVQQPDIQGITKTRLVSAIRAHLDVSESTAKRIVTDLVAHELAVHMGTGRGSLYYHADHHGQGSLDRQTDA